MQRSKRGQCQQRHEQRISLGRTKAPERGGEEEPGSEEHQGDDAGASQLQLEEVEARHLRPEVVRHQHVRLVDELAVTDDALALLDGDERRLHRVGRRLPPAFGLGDVDCQVDADLLAGQLQHCASQRHAPVGKQVPRDRGEAIELAGHFSEIHHRRGEGCQGILGGITYDPHGDPARVHPRQLFAGGHHPRPVGHLEERQHRCLELGAEPGLCHGVEVLIIGENGVLLEHTPPVTQCVKKRELVRGWSILRAALGDGDAIDDLSHGSERVADRPLHLRLHRRVVVEDGSHAATSFVSSLDGVGLVGNLEVSARLEPCD